MSAIYFASLSAASFIAAGALIVRVVAGNTSVAKPVSVSKPLPQPNASGSVSKQDSERLDLQSLDERALSTSADSVNVRIGGAIKRSFDIAFSLGLLAFLAPMLALTALAIRLDSKGPVIYRQKRVGRGGAVFEVYKFRSMVRDAESDGPQFAAVGDHRITRVGHIIRHLRIDEIPQTINVLRGEMSFVGPRPERPEFVESLRDEIPHYESRHLVKPGITGWAQVKHGYAASVEGAREKLRYDLYYIAKYTPLMDIAIVVMTVRVVLFGLGSR